MLCQQTFQFLAAALQQIISGQHSLKGNMFILGQVHPFLVLKIGKHLRKMNRMFHGITNYSVKQKKLQRAGQTAEPLRIKIPGYNPDRRRLRSQLLPALFLNKPCSLINFIKIMTVDSNPELT